MNNELKIIDRLNKEHKKLVPIPDLEIKFEKKSPASQDLQVDFQALKSPWGEAGLQLQSPAGFPRKVPSPESSLPLQSWPRN